MTRIQTRVITEARLPAIVLAAIKTDGHEPKAEVHAVLIPEGLDPRTVDIIELIAYQLIGWAQEDEEE